MKTLTLSSKSLFRAVQFSFWLLAALIIFLTELNSQHILAALYRNVILMLLGFGMTSFLAYRMPFFWSGFDRDIIRIMVTLIILVTISVAVTILVNLTVFQIFPFPYEQPSEFLFSSLFTHLTAFLIWTTLFYKYFSANGSSNFQPGAVSSRAYAERFKVSLGKEITVIRPVEISHFEADGDYVKVHALGRTHLIRKTIKDLIKELDPDRFQRIHRSYVINLEFVNSVKPHTNGDYFIIMKGGEEVRMSRSYNQVVKTYLDRPF